MLLVLNFVAAVSALGVAPKLEADGPSFHCQLQPRARRAVAGFDDPSYNTQWYLNNSMNIWKSWQNGYTGKGVVISVMDTGLDPTHDEFKNRYDARASYDFVKKNADPTPDKFARSSHGIKVAGLAAAEANNGKCGVGVAYDSRIGGLKFISGEDGNTAGGKDYMQSDALVYNMDYIDIYGLAWGPDDAIGSKVGYNKSPAAFKKGAEEGRNCKGSIYVHAAGNEGPYNDTCAYDGYVTDIYSISVTAVNPDGTKSQTSERCPAVMAGTFTRDGAQGVESPNYLMATADEDNKCSSTMASSSAAVGVASGIFALVLQANKNITWRDMQHLIARTSINNEKINDTERKWYTNGAGFRVNDAFGFGVLDAWALIEKSKMWTTVPEQLTCMYERSDTRPLEQVTSLVDTIPFTTSFRSCGIKHLEHIQLVIDLSYNRRLLEIELESPTKMKSYMIQGMRKLDFGSSFENYTTMSVHHWGESPIGDWKLTFRNVDTSLSASGELRYYKLIFYGTATDPETTTVSSPAVCNVVTTSSPASTTTTTTKKSSTTDKTGSTTSITTTTIIKPSNGLMLTTPPNSSYASQASLVILLLVLFTGYIFV